jgi:hypothetical protein
VLVDWLGILKLTFRLLVDLGPPLAGFANDRGIDERRQFLFDDQLSDRHRAMTAIFGGIYPEMVCDQAVKQMHIVLTKGAEVEELVNGGLLQSQLCKTCSLVSFQAMTRVRHLDRPPPV